MLRPEYCEYTPPFGWGCLCGQWSSPCCGAAGAVLSLRTRALQTGHVTQVAPAVCAPVLSCRQECESEGHDLQPAAWHALPHGLSGTTSPGDTSFISSVCASLTSLLFFLFLLERLDLKPWSPSSVPDTPIISTSHMFLFSFHWRYSSLSSGCVFFCVVFSTVLFLNNVPIHFTGLKTNIFENVTLRLVLPNCWVLLQKKNPRETTYEH